MKKKVYIETTIPSYIAAKSSRDIILLSRQEITREWWETSKHNFDLYTSQVVVDEISAGDKEQIKLRLELITGIKKLDVSEDVDRLASEYIKQFSFPGKAMRDAYHLALAVFYRMDILLTWNCRHLANADIIYQVNKLNNRLDLFSPIICTPDELFPIEEEY